MKLKKNCLFFNAKTGTNGATPDWGQELGQGHGYLMKQEGCSKIINGLVFNQIKDDENFSFGGGGRNSDIEIASVFHNVDVKVYDVENNVHNTYSIQKPCILIILKETSGTHIGRRTLKLNKAFSYDGNTNEDFYNEINEIISNPWFGYSLSYDNIDTGVLTLTIIKAPKPKPIKNSPDIVYKTAVDRKAIWNNCSEKYDSLNRVNEPAPTLRTNSFSAKNIIYFGSPGTGKSHQVNEITNETNTTQITFHPEYDYNSFVGGYKPTMNGKDIEYLFVPQAFTNIYVKAWNNYVSDEPTEHFYLQIEEINRGNCAEIFGDLFQLLDRDKDGYSKYSVDANKELRDYLKKEFIDENHKGLVDGKIKLPNNLTIIATMNTSDQSLFPMDSAFKRRWDWKYVRIDYKCPDSNFIIKLKSGAEYSWLEFLLNVNRKILEVTQSQDKQIGNWFVIPKNDNEISEDNFINKVIFYLWNDVFKDEDETIFRKDEKTIQYEEFFTNNDNSELVKYLLEERLNLEGNESDEDIVE